MAFAIVIIVSGSNHQGLLKLVGEYDEKQDIFIIYLQSQISPHKILLITEEKKSSL